MSTTAGTTNDIDGGDLILQGGQGKGTGSGGKIVLKTADVSSATGNTLNPYSTVMELNSKSTTGSGSGFANALKGAYIYSLGGEIITVIQIDFSSQNLITSLFNDSIIGTSGSSSDSHFYKLSSSNGTVYKIELNCILETSSGAFTDGNQIGIKNSLGTSSSLGTGSQSGDQRIFASTSGVTGFSTSSTMNDGFSNTPQSSDYLYLYHSTSGSSTYTQGKFIVKLYGSSF